MQIMPKPQHKRHVPRNVIRFSAPDTYFGHHDRCVPVVVDGQVNRRECIPLEEYIVEQCHFHVTDGIVVLNASNGITYDARTGMHVPNRYDRQPKLPRNDDLVVYSWNQYQQWEHGADLTYAVPETRHLEQSRAGGCGFIFVMNKGPEVERTNYFETEAAENGLALLSFNENTVRLLLPKRLEVELRRELRGEVHPVITRGRDTSTGKMLYEVIWFDGSPNPFSIALENTDGTMPVERMCRVGFLVYGEGPRLIAKCEETACISVPSIPAELGTIQTALRSLYNRAS